MLPYDADLWKALAESQTGSVRAVARYGSEQQEITVARAGSMSFQGDAVVQGSGTVTVYGSGTDSLVPRSRDALLAPFGQEVSLWRTVSVRSQAWEIPLGVFRITKAANMWERRRRGRVRDWKVTLTLQDRCEQIAADDFLGVMAPLPDTTVWAEIRRLSPIPVQQALGDRTVPPATVYESRMDAITVLMSLLGGVPHLTRQGVLTARAADVWASETVSQFTISGVIELSDELTNQFYNQVRVSSTNDESIVAYAINSDLTDPRSVQRAGGRTYKQSAPIYETLESAQLAANTILNRLMSRRSTVAHIECLPQALLLELGDYGTFVELDAEGNAVRSVTGEVANIQAPLGPTDTVGVDVIVAEGA